MKKIIGILGIAALSFGTFFTTSGSTLSRDVNITSLISLNTANAEDTGGEQSCYNNLKTGSAQLVRFCLDCRRKAVEYGFEPGKC